MSAYETLPLAEPERERIAERIFSDYTQTSPEEWAARWAHTVGTSAFGDFRYRNARMGKWIYRLHQILLRPGEVERCQGELLTPEEIREIEKKAWDF